MVKFDHILTNSPKENSKRNEILQSIESQGNEDSKGETKKSKRLAIAS